MLCRSTGNVEDMICWEIYRTQGSCDEKPTDTRVTLVKATEEVIDEILPTEPICRVDEPSLEECLMRFTGRQVLVMRCQRTRRSRRRKASEKV